MPKPKDEILALAENTVGAAVGDVVEVESNSGSAPGGRNIDLKGSSHEPQQQIHCGEK